MRKKPYTSQELFRIINENLKKQGLLPDILDYGIPGRDNLPIKTISWNTVGTVDFGGNEGIYLDICLEGDIGDKHDKVHIGTYKTLREDKDAFKAMGDLNAEFVFAVRDFVEKNEEDFNWTGYDVGFYTGDKKRIAYWSPTHSSVERLCETTFARFADVEYASIIDNETKTESRL